MFFSKTTFIRIKGEETQTRIPNYVCDNKFNILEF